MNDFIRLPRRIRQTLQAAKITTLADLIAADRDCLPISANDRRRLEFLVDRRAKPLPPPPIDAEPTELPVIPQATTACLPELLTTTQAARFLQLNRRTVAAMCADRRLRAWKLGDDWRIPHVAIVELLNVGGNHES